MDFGVLMGYSVRILVLRFVVMVGKMMEVWIKFCMVSFGLYGIVNGRMNRWC